jgi:hypothetical protein
MKTKYGEMPLEVYKNYLNRMVSRVFKILPMKEENCPTLDQYIDAVVRELVGNRDIVESVKANGELLVLTGTLISLKDVDSMVIFKSDVFKAIDTIKKMKANIEG